MNPLNRDRFIIIKTEEPSPLPKDTTRELRTQTVKEDVGVRVTLKQPP